ncbi:MAG: alpha/beta-hydrolase family protein [Candidatus Nanopelagicales bacterium]|jgi:uncharacterized membrane protein|nr:alpha/beta-hydrolase family protein [Candidatus Nanopelagicales bacterium]
MTTDVSKDVPAPVDPTEPAPQPTPAKLRRVFHLRLSRTGLVVGALFFALSLLPSLLPRAPYVQGVVSGVTVMVGYALGAGGQALWTYLGIPTLRGRARTITLGILVGFIALLTVRAAWQQVGWQNDLRELFGMEPTSPMTWPIIAAVTLLVAGLLLVLARSIWLLIGTVVRWLGRHLPTRLSWVLGVTVIVVLLWALVSGVLVRGFFAGANAMFSLRDDATDPGITQPLAPERSGSPESLVAWEDLGRQGRKFTGWGPTVAQLDAFHGGGAKVPVRAYVGLASAPTLQERADLLLAELQRTGAFDRKVLVVATTTGTGFLDANGIEPVEYAFNGDTAIGGVQYSYLPSWISLLADQEAVRETSLVVFETIHEYWSTLPEDDRPALHLYGLSLGSHGVEAILSSPEILNEPISGALMSGPPFVNPLHRAIEDARQPGTPPWQPIYREGRTVRFTAEQDGLAVPPGPWGPTRLVYLQHNSDPVVFFDQELALLEPDWLLEGQRGPDISENMVWVPLVTMWQVALDLPGAGAVPEGFGHLYTRRSNLVGWVGITQPEGWTAQRTDELVAFMDAQPTLEEYAATLAPTP